MNSIIQRRLTGDQFFPTEFPKKQIYIHHTAGNDNAIATVDDWNATEEQIGTAFVIDRKGVIVQCFSSKHWGYHLGLKKQTFNDLGLPYIPLDKTSIGIELCNCGYVEKVGSGLYTTYTGKVIKTEDVVEFSDPYRGHRYFQYYTKDQLASLKNLLEYLCEKFNIPKNYNHDMFSVNYEALSRKPGIWTHTSVRSDKTDCFPQMELRDMLKSLTA